MSDDDRRAKLLRKLKACLALSASPEPHEAAAALRQAQKIMAELGVTEADLETMEVTQTTVKTREGFGRCRTMMHLCKMLEDVFGVRYIFTRNPGTADRLNVVYVGARDRVVLAEYAHRVVWRSMQASWAEYLAHRPDIKGDSGKRQSFHIGWLAQVRAKVQAISPNEKEQRAIDTFMRAKFPGMETLASRGKQLDSNAFMSGALAAQDFELHRPLDEGQLAIGHDKATGK